MGVVESIIEEYKGIVDFLAGQKQPSLQSDVNKYFTKILVLSAASYFEEQIQTILVEFVSAASSKDPLVTSFLKKKAINRQYHTYFNWTGKNANSFFTLFGDEFKRKLEAEIKADAKLDKSVKAFLEIGDLRNRLVHNNFAAYSLNPKTSDEIFKLYEEAVNFINLVKEKLKPIK